MKYGNSAPEQKIIAVHRLKNILVSYEVQDDGTDVLEQKPGQARIGNNNAFICKAKNTTDNGWCTSYC